MSPAPNRHYPRAPSPQQIEASIRILVFGAFAMVAFFVLLEIGNFIIAHQVPGDGAPPVISRPRYAQAAWPIAAWFILTAVAPFLPRLGRQALLCISIPLFYGACIVFFPGIGFGYASTILVISAFPWYSVLRRS
jgi:hypothetical protein